MAKTIKFNLNCDGRPIRTLEDLRNNFSVEDVLEYYHNGLLCRWLDVRGYRDELKKVKAITGADDLPVIKSLIKVFDVETEETTVEEDTYILRYQKEREAFIAKHKEKSFEAATIVTDHCAGYQKCIQTIIENKNDIARIKAATKEIDENYHDLYDLDFRMLFHVLLSCAPMAVFVMLMRENMRGYYLPSHVQSETGKFIAESDEAKTMANILGGIEPLSDVAASVGKTFSWMMGARIDGTEKLSNTLSKIEQKISNDDYEKIYGENRQVYIEEDRSAMYKKLCILLGNYSELHNILGDNLREFAGTTKDYWQDIEPKGKHYLILSMEPDNFVRASNHTGGDMSAFDINNQFVILDGIDYKSKNDSHKLLYMEV